MASQNPYQALSRFRRLREDQARKALAERLMTLKHMKSERAAIAASLVASRHPSNDVSMLVLDDLSRARTRTALDEHDARISELQADIERVEESLRVAARDRQVADRLANRSDEKRRVDVQRQERRDEDEVAIRSFEGEPED